MPDIDVYKIGDEEVNQEEFVPYTVEKYNMSGSTEKCIQFCAP